MLDIASDDGVLRGIAACYHLWQQLKTNDVEPADAELFGKLICSFKYDRVAEGGGGEANDFMAFFDTRQAGPIVQPRRLRWTPLSRPRNGDPSLLSYQRPVMPAPR